MISKFFMAILSACMLAISLLYMPLAQAVVYLDSVRVCYEFNQDEMISRDICILSAQSGAGGGSFDLMYKGENYHFYYTDEKPINSYYRYPSLDRVLDSDDLFESGTEYLVCFLHKPYDLCYTHSRSSE